MKITEKIDNKITILPQSMAQKTYEDNDNTVRIA
jgi:hypothetical protein